MARSWRLKCVGKFVIIKTSFNHPWSRILSILISRLQFCYVGGTAQRLVDMNFSRRMNARHGKCLRKFSWKFMQSLFVVFRDSFFSGAANKLKITFAAISLKIASWADKLWSFHRLQLKELIELISVNLRLATFISKWIKSRWKQKEQLWRSLSLFVICCVI